MYGPSSKEKYATCWTSHPIVAVIRSNGTVAVDQDRFKTAMGSSKWGIQAQLLPLVPSTCH